LEFDAAPGDVSSILEVNAHRSRHPAPAARPRPKPPSFPTPPTQLYVGDGTIKTHISHVLTKLGLRDRMQAVVFAYESGIVEPDKS
jgi:hypothetical protein